MLVTVMSTGGRLVKTLNLLSYFYILHYWVKFSEVRNSKQVIVIVHPPRTTTLDLVVIFAKFLVDSVSNPNRLV